MTTAVITCDADAPVEEAEQLMEDKMVRRLIVVDAQRQPVGLLSLDDLASEPEEMLYAGAVMEHLHQA